MVGGDEVVADRQREGEQATRSGNPRHLIVRTAWLYGEGGRNFPDQILRKAREGEMLEVVDDQRGSPTWTEDLAPALLRLVTTSLFGTFHCTSSGSCSWYEFAKHLVERDGSRVSIEPIKTPPGPPVRPEYSVLSNERYEKATGHRLRTWEESADAYLDSLSRKAMEEER